MEFNFKNDWKEYVQNKLSSLGFKYSEDLTENSLNLININRRLPTQVLRKVIFSKEFICPVENINGLNALIKKIEKGQCLIPNLSTSILKSDFNDKTLDDWGIHHFHLGDKEKKGMIERTKNIVFVFVLPKCAFFLQVLPHGKGHGDVWVNTSLLEILHSNWPKIISHMKVKLSGSSLTSKERIALRKFNVNINIKVSDGTVYFSPGGGLLSNGKSMSDYGTLQRVYNDLDYLENLVKQKRNEIENKISTLNGPLNLKVDFTDLHNLRVVEINSQTILEF